MRSRMKWGLMIEVAWSRDGKADLDRLKRWRKSYAQEVYRILREELAVDGHVGDGYKPHVLTNPNSRFFGLYGVSRIR